MITSVVWFVHRGFSQLLMGLLGNVRLPSRFRGIGSLSAIFLAALAPHTGAAGVTPTASLPTWNPTTDFSVTNNSPNGVWTYGFMDTAFTTFTPYVNKGTTGTYRNWYGAGSDQTPAVGYNTANAMNGVPAGYMLLHPGQAQEPTVLRWTAPVAATLKVVGQFHAGDSGVMQVAVRKGATVLFNATDAGSFDLTVAVAVGDTLDFTVFGGYAFGSTGLQTTISATSFALPLTTGSTGKRAIATLSGGTLVQLTVTGSGDLANASLQVNPDGSLAAPAGAPWTAANVGAAYPNVAGFPFGDGINHFVGGGLNYDHGGGSGWMFAGKQTTDTTDSAAIRSGAVVGTFAANPAREDWFFIGYGGTVTVPAGGATLYLAVNESNSTDNHGSYTVVATTATPGNDSFAAAEILSGNSVSRTGTNIVATKENSEPNHAGNVGGASVWWKWTAPSTGVASISTVGSSFDTVLGVYTGNAVNALTAVASDDNSGAANTSKLTFNAIAGTTYAIAVDGAGGTGGNVILSVGYTYTTTTLAGTVGSNGSTDGTGAAARFDSPAGVAVDGSGSVYVADYQNAIVRKITSAGVVTTLAGTAGTTGATDATGAAAQFNRPFGVALDANGNVFVSDYAANHTIRKITPAGVVTTFAGSAGQAGSTDATGSAARFINPSDLAFDTAGNLYVADRGNHTVRKVTSAGVVTTLAGSAGISGSADGTGSAALFNHPQGVAVDASGNVFVSDSDNHTIRKITSAGVVTTLAGSAGIFGNVDGAGSVARFRFPYSVAVDAAGNVFVNDYGNGTIRKITPTGVVLTVATGFNLAQGLALDSSGNLLVADSANHVVRKLIPSSAPVIASISPATAFPGGTVTLTGAGFLGATAVAVNGLSAASFTIVNDSTLTFTVPAGAVSGPVIITTVGGVSTANATLTLVKPSPSALDGFAPSAGGGNPNVSRVLAAVVQPDGKIIIGGEFTTLQASGSAAVTNVGRIARLNRDGTIDPTFVGTANGLVASLTLLADGKILVGGSFSQFNGTARGSLVRLNADGTLDTSFTSAAAGALINKTVVQPDGKILIGGTMFINNTSNVRIARLLTDGSFDSTYTLVTTTGVTANIAEVNDIALQPDGAILIAGTFYTVSGQNRGLLARLTSSGVLDPTFDPAISKANGNAPRVSRIVVQPDGKLLVGGNFDVVAGQTRTYLARLRADGTLDASFNATLGGGCTDISLQPDGSLIIGGGFTSVSSVTRNKLARLFPDGSLDASFTAGTSDPVSDSVNVLVLQPDGSTLVAGGFSSLGGQSRGRIARLQPEGTVERTLALDVTANVVGAFALQPNGKIILGGHFGTVGGVARPFVARLNADATLDTTFNPSPDASVIAPVVLADGRFLLGGRFANIGGLSRTGLARFGADGVIDPAFDAAISGGTLNSVLLQSDGKIVIGGSFTSVGGQTRNRLARLNPDGTLDAGFNPDVKGEVFGLALQGDGSILFSGDFTQVGATTRNRLARVSSAGVLDATFDPAANGTVHAVAVQADGKIIATGFFTTIAGETRAGYARLMPSGAIDAPFNPATSTGGVTVVQADGRILVGGVFSSIAAAPRPYVARLLASGAIDADFNVGADGNAGALALQSDGKLLVGGDFAYLGGESRRRLARLNAPGPTTTALAATASAVTLTRTGPLPELAWVTFETSTDRSAWTPLGTAARVGTTANWQITGLTLPTGTLFYVRTRAAVPTGVYGASSMMEYVQQLYLAPVGPVITTQPVSTTVALGANVTLSVTATGATSYQWVKNGNSVLNGTNSTLTFTPVTLADVGNYYVLTNGSGGTTQSNGVTLNVTVPVPVALVANSTVLKTPRYLATDGTDWFVSGVRQDNSQSIFKFPFAGGAVDAPYVGLASPLSVALLGSDVYWIDPNGGPISDTWIRKAPKTGLGPVTSIYTGSSFGEPQPLVDGSGLATDGTALYAADEYAGTMFKLNPDGTNLTAFSAGPRYGTGFNNERIVVIAHEAGTLYGADINRTGASASTPTVFSIPVSGNAFTALVNGSPLVSPAGVAVMGGKLYVSDPGANNTIWQLPLTGGTPVPYYSGTPFQGIAGLAAYNGELYVADSAGGAIYRLAQTPAAAPVITAPPAAVATANGANVSFSVTATGIPAVTYQWRFNGNPITNATNATLALTNVGFAQVGNYSVTVTNGVNSVTSAAVALSGPVVEPVFVTQPPAFASGNVGSSLTLTAAATATAGVTYQWRKHGQAIAGATNATLTLNGLTLFESGLYDVLVTTSGVGFPSTASRVVVHAPVSSANVLTASSTFTPRIEDQFASFSLSHRAADGKVYLSGNFTSLFGAPRPGFVRLLADGTLDTAFVPAPVFHSFSTPRVYAVAVQSDGRVLIGGQFTTVGGLARDGLARLNLDGTVDPTFVPPVRLANSERVLAVAVQPDGKILVAGSFNDPGVNIARLNADGSRDTTFAVAGGFSGAVNALALQSDGKVVVGGNLTSYQGTSIGRIARLTATGALDTDYRTAGGSGFGAAVRSLVLQPDGKLLVGGEFTSYGGSPRNRLVRLLDTGALDVDFSIGGGFNNTVSQVALQSDGAVVVVGDFTTFDSNANRGIVRLTSAGARDITFVTSSELDAPPGFSDGADGVALLANGVLVLSNDSSRYASPTANVGPLTRLTALGALDPAFAPETRSAGTVEALVPAPGGRWFVAGSFTHVNGVVRKNLARLFADGSLDPDFAPVGTAFNSSVLTLAVQPDGKVVAGGQFTAYDGTTANRIVRLTATGARDAGFDTGTGFDLTVASLALQTDGKLLVGGRFTTFNSVARNKLVRLTAAGSLDPTFTQTGAGFGFSGSINELAVLADGRVYAAGDFTSYAGTARFRIVRFLADGLLDSAFVVDNSNAINYTIDSLVVQPDGKLLVGGQFYGFGDFSTTGLARINPDGTRDTTFAAFESNGNVTTIALLSDGRIVVGGSFTTRNFSAPLPLFHLARLSPTGIVEPDFGAPLFNSTPTVVQPSANGALLVAGNSLYFPGVISAGLARLDAAPVPSITTPPAKQIASVGDSVTFAVTATGPGLTYRWLKDGLVIAGATGTSFTIPSAQLADVGSYAVTISNIYGSVTTPAVELTGAGAPPTISALTAPAVLTGANAQLVVTATGVTAYQWRKLGVPISGNTTATTATLTLPGAVPADASFYDVLVYNGLSRTRSDSVRLAVTAAQPVTSPVSPDLAFPAFTESFTGYGTPNRIFAQPDGKYYVSGDFVSVDGTARIGLVRFLANGTVDSSFTTEVSGGTINVFAAQADGKLIIAGDFHRVNGVEANHLARLNTDGTLDTAFCSGPNSGTFDSIYSVAVQADGKILLGGNLSSIGGTFGGGGLVRLNSSGTVDTVFGNTLETGFNGPVDALAVDSNGRIFAGGRFTTFQGNAASYFAVLTASGSRAANFAGLTTGFNNRVTSILLLADGRVIAGGSFDAYNGTPASRIVRLATDGAIDSTFLSGGGFDYVDGAASVSALALQADGKLLVTGAFARFDRVSARNLARLNANGTRDTSFDTSAGLDAPGTSIAVLSGTDFAVVGEFTGAFESARARYARFSGSSLSTHLVTRWGNFDGEINTVVPAPGGKWLVGGYFSRIGGARAVNLARLNADGSLDSTFSLAQGPVYGSVYALAVQGDGRILVGGDFNHYGTEEIYGSAGGLVRLNADGTRDTDFQLGNGFDSVVRALAVQPDGKILVGGGFMNLNNVPSARFARLNANGTRDTSFALGSGFGSDVYVITVLPDGRLAVGGEFASYNGNNAVRGLIYLNADGTRDTTVATGYTTGFSGSVTSLVLQPDGRLLVAGGFSSYGSTVIYSVARLTPAGALDSTFAIGSTFFYGEGFASIVSLALQSDGKIIIAGDFPTVNDVNGTQQIARFTATGAHDPAFAPNFSGDLRSVALRADGKLFVAGRQLYVSDTLRYGLLPIGGPAGILPTITTPPVAQSAVFGGSATFSVAATGTPAPTYQWQRNNINLPGATNASYTVTSASQANAGLYRVIVTNSAGSVPTTPVALDVVTRNLINFYARAIVAPSGSIASSFTIEGTQSKTVLLVGVGGTRAAASTVSGGSAAPLGLADPRLVLTNAAGSVLGSNDNWTTANASALSAASTQVAATPGLTATGEGANDAALLVTLAPGTYHVTLDGAGSSGGAALLQIYDADTDGRPRLVMFTLRAKVGAGANVVTAGFTVDGTLSKTVLLRVLGESLGFSPGVLEDPFLTLFRGATQLAESDDTDTSGNGPAAVTAVGQVGARPVVDRLDSTLSQTVTPGVYTAQITPFSNSESGTVLFELFEADAQRATTVAPVITYLTPDQPAVAGSTAVFGVVAVAKPAATYQWRKGGVAIDGATNAILQLTNVQSSAATTYDVIVTSGAASVTSPPRSLTILPEFHSADTNQDRRISLLELSRVIQLYNYQNGATRTGEYRTQATGTEDGFTLGPGPITSYHSADYNRDGRIDGDELSRVIVLYNYQSGTARTGDYHPAVNTEDGFAPGPLFVPRVE